MEPDQVVFTHTRLADLANVKPGRLRYWETSGLVHAVVQPSTRGRGSVRLYSYTDALTVLVLASLRESLSLQQIRQIVDHLRKREFDVPEIRFAFAGQRVFFQTPDGVWEDGRQRDQIVLSGTLDLRILRTRLDGAAARSENAVGKTERRRGALGSKPLVAGTRVPVAAVVRYLERGTPVEEILAAYPALTEDDVNGIRPAASA